MLERDTKNLEILLVSLLKEEVVNLPRGAYHLSQAMKNKQEENANYNFLPETSIVRAIVSRNLFPSLATLAPPHQRTGSASMLYLAS